LSALSGLLHSRRVHDLLIADPLATWLLVASFVAFMAGEVVATYVGQARDGRRRPVGAVIEALLATGRRGNGHATRQDKGTFWLVVLIPRVAVIGVIILTVHSPAVRAGANTWGTFALALLLILAGAALRDWSIFTLGRYFRRQVTIEPDQPLIRTGPYRCLRHPSYTGILIAFTGIGLAVGSWLAAAVALTAVLIALLPRIHVEETALRRAFPSEYDEYANATSRLIPHLW